MAKIGQHERRNWGTHQTWDSKSDWWHPSTQILTCNHRRCPTSQHLIISSRPAHARTHSNKKMDFAQQYAHNLSPYGTWSCIQVVNKEATRLLTQKAQTLWSHQRAITQLPLVNKLAPTSTVHLNTKKQYIFSCTSPVLTAFKKPEAKEQSIVL